MEGVSLIEVMVAILVFSIGLLGIAMLQMRGAQFTKESGSRTSAIILARSLADAMRANPGGAHPAGGVANSAYLYDGSTAYTAKDCASTTLGTPSDIAKRDIACWRVALGNALPAPADDKPLAAVTANKDLGTLIITVSWTGVADDKTSDPNQSYSFSYLQ
ncbi:type IV pilus modification protein PilV [Dyella sp. 333MFSha]|uniref:type IV pilus modification protein PilV n=1 Tax=Dyella sp. 333MFSha TaxID=1798240 RepID=UPI0021012AC9|nr:type IV pilus modification protein PilV [Dyella sp. 333MFSha]